MEKLETNLLSLIGLQLDIPDLFSYCRVSKNLYRKVWQNKYFWILKTQKDFNFYKNYKLLYKEKWIKNHHIERGIPIVNKVRTLRLNTIKKLIKQNDIETINYFFEDRPGEKNDIYPF